MNSLISPELARLRVEDKLNDLRREAAEESMARAARFSRPIAPRRRRPRLPLQRAVGHALIGLGRTLAGDPA